MNSTTFASVFSDSGLLGSMGSDSELLGSVGSVLLAARMELLVFFSAVVAHFLLFGNASRGRRTKLQMTKDKGQELNTSAGLPRLHGAGRRLQDAVRSGQHHQVLHCWTDIKNSKELFPVPLDKVVESMQYCKKDLSFIHKELHAFFARKWPVGDHGRMDMVNNLMESLSKHMDVELMEKIMDMLPTVGLAPEPRTYESLLQAYFNCCSFAEVRRVAAEMRTKEVPCNAKALLTIIKTAVKTSRLDEALQYFGELKVMRAREGPISSSPSMAVRNAVSRIIELACRQGCLADLLPALDGVPITEQALQLMLAECLKQGDTGLMKRVGAWARAHEVPMSDSSYTLLVKGLTSAPALVEELVHEQMAKKTKMSTEFILAVVAFSAQRGTINLADRLFQQVRPTHPAVLSAFIRLYIDAEEFEKACDAYVDAQRPMLDARSERCLMNAALRCGRNQLAQSLLDATPSDVAKHIAMIRNCGEEQNLQGAISIFRSLSERGVALNSVVYNSVLDACVNCRDLKRAEAWMQEIKEAGMADVVSYNTLIKAHLHSEAFDKVRALMEEMRTAGFQPNRVTYNELVNAMVAKRCPIWDVLDEMRAAGMPPNQVTCSILLKNLHRGSEEVDILKTMEMIGSVEEPMDEVLLSSVVEACVRIGKPDLISSKLEQLRGGQGVAITGSHTFGSLIKAYGSVGDINGVWRCWKEMRSRHVRPTSVTLGCMVEAVVSNGDADGALELVHQMRKDEQCRPALNAVIYCSVLKGFAREKRLDRVWAVYAEMQEQSMESIVTYNTIIDACTRCGRMDEVPEVIAAMERAKVVPNIITYSTMLKGHCQSNNIQEAFALLAKMRAETDLRPDEVMYNSLLDGCAQQGLVDQGARLLEEMQAEGVRPSNFTLSVLVKLFSRSRKLDKAFSVVQELTGKFKFQPNVHVHTNLIQACITARQFNRALGCLEQMFQDGVQPCARTYAILLRALLASGQPETAAGLLRAALGLPERLPALARFGSATVCKLDDSLVNQTIVGLADGQQGLAVQLLAQLRECKPGIFITAETQAKVLASSRGTPSAAPFSPSSPQTFGGKGCGRTRGGGGHWSSR